MEASALRAASRGPRAQPGHKHVRGVQPQPHQPPTPCAPIVCIAEAVAKFALAVAFCSVHERVHIGGVARSWAARDWPPAIRRGRSPAERRDLLMRMEET
eukprot:365688-Chlamydomonas_euryale.AAC.11